MEHVLTPWSLVQGQSDGRTHIVGGRGEGVVSFGPFEDEFANAAFIIRAVNSHEELVMTLKMLSHGLNDPDRADVLAIIAKAEGVIGASRAEGNND